MKSALIRLLMLTAVIVDLFLVTMIGFRARYILALRYEISSYISPTEARRHAIARRVSWIKISPCKRGKVRTQSESGSVLGA